ncbi:hypothetical protein [Microbacterium allomyrinae]|uniref:Tail assembly chaperone n=1 Tax=Microbacterium allomyrinae TaxID=2830666 RepID=A0A9X1LU34_9MICO|nr:hypothetical protein [Microbacterium allomyrinae]MCC2031832.1 hypothetical protein [Microbacterium allomyrinae]
MANVPAGAKTPEDHKPKTAKPEKITVTVGEGDDARELPALRVTVHDIEVTVLEEALNDFEVLDQSAQLQDRNAAAFPRLLRLLVGDDDWRRILDELRGVNGRVAVEDGVAFVSDLMQALNPNS